MTPQLLLYRCLVKYANTNAIKVTIVLNMIDRMVDGVFSGKQDTIVSIVMRMATVIDRQKFSLATPTIPNTMKMIASTLAVIRTAW